MIAKPKSSRNSSIEAFVVCQDYSPPKDYIPTMTPILISGKNKIDTQHLHGTKNKTIACFFFSVSPSKHTQTHTHTHTHTQIRTQNKQGTNRYTLKFVACGDLSGFDSDANYPLQLKNQKDFSDEEKTGLFLCFFFPFVCVLLFHKHCVRFVFFCFFFFEETAPYQHRNPVAPPINPNYQYYQNLKQNQVFTRNEYVRVGPGLLVFVFVCACKNKMYFVFIANLRICYFLEIANLRHKKRKKNEKKNIKKEDEDLKTPGDTPNPPTAKRNSIEETTLPNTDHLEIPNVKNKNIFFILSRLSPIKSNRKQTNIKTKTMNEAANKRKTSKQ